MTMQATATPAQLRQTPEYWTLALICQALKFSYTEHWDILAPTTKNGKALPNRAGQLAESMLKLCETDTGKLGKLIQNCGTDDEPLYQAIFDAQELVKEMIETAMIASRRLYDQNPAIATGGVAELREYLRSIRAGEVAIVDPAKFEGARRCGIL